MSIALDGLGLRMLSIRKKHGLTQSVMAAKLDISDRTYNYYEQQKRELPASVAVKFCNLFEVGLDWLYAGETKSFSNDQLALIVASVEAAILENNDRNTDYSANKMGKFVAMIVDKCSHGTATPKEEASSLFGLLE